MWRKCILVYDTYVIIFLFASCEKIIVKKYVLSVCLAFALSLVTQIISGSLASEVLIREDGCLKTVSVILKLRTTFSSYT